MEWHRDDYVLSDDARRVDVERTFALLNATYWGERRPRDVVANVIPHSLCFALLRQDEQIGFARVVSDYTVFSWLSDVVIDPKYRHRGLGKWMMSCIMAHPAIAHTQKVLQTRDAHTLYENFGFSANPALMSTAVRGLTETPETLPQRH